MMPEKTGDPLPSANVNGYVEYLDSYQVRGWAYAPEVPHIFLKVTALVDGNVYAHGRADLFREDLRVARVGDGNHGFVINFPAQLNADNLERLVVNVFTDEGGRFILQPLPSDYVKLAKPAFSDRPKLSTFSGEARDQTCSPLFILGSARSGTSAIAHALLGTGHFDGYEEGHLLGILGHINVSIDNYYERNRDEISGNRNTMIWQVAKCYIADAVNAIFVNATRELFPRGVWLDKTPTTEMVRIAPRLLEIWPGAKFLFMRRRGIENVMSRLRRFPDLMFSDHCDGWSSAMQSWLHVRGLLGDRCLEIDQHQLAQSPRAVATTLAEFLELPVSSRALMEQAITFDRPQRTGDKIDQVIALSQTGWEAHDKSIFKSICGPMMEAYGYTYDEKYSFELPGLHLR